MIVVTLNDIPDSGIWPGGTYQVRGENMERLKRAKDAKRLCMHCHEEFTNSVAPVLKGTHRLGGKYVQVTVCWKCFHKLLFALQDGTKKLSIRSDLKQLVLEDRE